MEPSPGPFISWVFTYALHSTLLLGAGWLLDRRFTASPRLRETTWKAAAFGAVVAATLQSAALFFNPSSTPIGGQLSIVTEQPATLAVLDAAEVPTLQSHQTAPAPAGTPKSIRALPFWPQWLLTLWLAGVLASCVRLALRIRAVRQYAGARWPAHPGLDAQCSLLCYRLGVRSRPRVTISSNRISPLVIAGREIVLAEALVSRLSYGELNIVLAHELAHVRRRDFAWLSAFNLLEIIGWFHPLNRIARQKAQECAELICDRYAVDVAASPLQVATTLLATGEWLSHRPPALVSPLTEDASAISQRVRALLDGRPVHAPRWIVAAAIGLVAAYTVMAPAVTQATQINAGTGRMIPPVQLIEITAESLPRPPSARVAGPDSLEAVLPRAMEMLAANQGTADDITTIRDVRLPFDERREAMLRATRAGLTAEAVDSWYESVPDRAMRVELIEWLSQRPRQGASMNRLSRIVAEAGILEEMDAAICALARGGPCPVLTADAVVSMARSILGDTGQTTDVRKRAYTWARIRGGDALQLSDLSVDLLPPRR